MNLFIDGVLHDDAVSRPVYAATMSLLVVLAAALTVWQSVGPKVTAALVVVGDVVYVVVATTTTDPLLYAPPLMMLFTCFAAAWFLGPRMLALHMVLVVAACAGALAHSYPDTAAWIAQVTVNSVVLNMVTLVVFLLRRRIQRLLDDTEALSSTDPLTGLANRRSLAEFLDAAWDRAMREHTSIGAVMIDIDHFKKYNDRYGHATGDICLKRVAAALASAIRPTDLAARYGGEEFTLLLPGVDLAVIRKVAERAHAAIAELGQPHTDAPGGFVTASLGLAVVIPSAGTSIQQLVENADAALYAAKRGGRNRVVGPEAPGSHPLILGT
jgi:diguanylate cyclase (GGDEF)-like protein